MISTKPTAILCAVLTGAALLTACGPKQPQPILNQPPTPAQPGAAVPFTPVKGPLDLTPFEKAPCQILTKEQVAAVVADPPDDVRPFAKTAPEEFRCDWVSPHGPLVSISEPLIKPANLVELAASRTTRLNHLEPWSEVSLNGYPVAIYHQWGGPNDCDVAVATSDTKMLQFSFGGEGSPSRYWAKDRCAGVLKTADFVIGNLRRH